MRSARCARTGSTSPASKSGSPRLTSSSKGAGSRRRPKDGDGRVLSLDLLTCELFGERFQRRRADARALGVQVPEDAFAFSPDPAGRTPWNPDTMTHRYRRYARRVGIASSLKELRHYSATQLLAAGTDLNTVAGRLGHAEGSTTLKFCAVTVHQARRSAGSRHNPVPAQRTPPKGTGPNLPPASIAFRRRRACCPRCGHGRRGWARRTHRSFVVYGVRVCGSERVIDRLIRSRIMVVSSSPDWSPRPGQPLPRSSGVRRYPASLLAPALAGSANSHGSLDVCLLARWPLDEELLARCPAQHAVDHYVNGEAEPFVDISSDQLSGVGSNERKVVGRQAGEVGRDFGSQCAGVGAP